MLKKHSDEKISGHYKNGVVATNDMQKKNKEGFEEIVDYLLIYRKIY